MSSYLRKSRWLFFFAAISVAATGQLLPTQPAPATAPANQPAADPLGRTTPSGTVFGFLQAAQAGNYSIAAQYLQMTNAKRAAQGQELAVKLKGVMDRAFSGNLRHISNQPDGTPQEGVSPDRQRIGVLSAGDVDADLDLVQVSDSGGVRIWLISSETLAKVPDLYDQLQVRQIESHLPEFSGAAPIGGYAGVAMVRSPVGHPARRRLGMAGNLDSRILSKICGLDQSSRACRLVLRFHVHCGWSSVP